MRSLALAASFTLAAAPPIRAQVPTSAPTPSRELAALGHLPWRALGPTNNAGRVSVVAGIAGDPSTYFVAGANGGIIKTTNGGVTFRPIFDKQDVSDLFSVPE